MDKEQDAERIATSPRERRASTPAEASTRNPTGVTIRVQTTVLYQGSEPVGVS